MLIRICILSDAVDMGEQVARLLRQPDVVVSRLPIGESWNQLGRESFDLLIAARSAIPRPYTESVAELGELPDGPELVVLAEDVDPEARASLQAAGAFAVIDADLSEPTLRKTLNTLIRRRREALIGRFRQEAPSGGALEATADSRSPAMRELLRLADRVAGSDSSLLIVGETGVGKEWLARWICDRGPRAAGPFVAVNCSALPSELIESELFGHEEGAFTGARRPRRGQFELAHGGTLFLDEITEMPHAAQAKLLRAIQDREIRPLGSERSLRVDVRIMAATNRDPVAAVRSKSLREDLFYRLGVVTLEVPPLRDRTEDLATLAEEFLEQHRRQLGRPEVREISARVLRAFERYPWPGNVRELINVLERAVLLSAGPAVTLGDLPAAIARPPWSAVGAGGEPESVRPRPGWDRFWEGSFGVPLHEARATVVEEYEREYVRRLLEQTGGRVGEAARLAGVEERTLYNKMRRYRLAKEEFRRGSQ